MSEPDEPERGKVVLELTMHLSGMDQPWVEFSVSYEPSSFDVMSMSMYPEQDDGPACLLPLPQAKRLHAFLGMIIAAEKDRIS